MLCGQVAVRSKGDGRWACAIQVAGYSKVNSQKVIKRRKQNRLSILAEQDWKCAICKEDLEDGHLDHNHGTDLVRSVLCLKCNAGIGLFNEDPATLRAAAAYLEAHTENPGTRLFNDYLRNVSKTIWKED